MIPTRHFGHILLLLIVLFSSCEKAVEKKTDSTPVFVSLFPGQGKPGAAITILGRNFSEQPGGNIVMFGDKQAALLHADKGSLVVAVPADGSSGEVQLRINGTTLSAGSFTYLAPAKEYIVQTFCGTGVAGFDNGNIESAAFFNPEGVALDINGNVVVADRGNHAIRSITVAQTASTLAGFNGRGFVNGSLSVATFSAPWKCAADKKGNLYVADRDNHAIRKIAATGVVTTLAGGIMGFADGVGENARFNQPVDLCVDASDNVYVADNNNHRIRKITPQGTVSTLAGSIAGFADGAGTTAMFKNPSGVDVDESGNVYVADRLNNRIRKITPAGDVTTVAGTAAPGRDDGAGDKAAFNQPYGIAVGVNHELIVADLSNHIIRKVSAAGEVSTIAGTSAGFQDGSGITARFSSPTDVAVAADGSVYIADLANNRIRRIAEIEK